MKADVPLVWRDKKKRRIAGDIDEICGERFYAESAPVSMTAFQGTMRHRWGRLFLCAVVGVATEVNVPTDETAEVRYDAREKSEMDTLATRDGVASFCGTLASPWVLFLADRAHSIRTSAGLPQRWLNQLPAHARVFSGDAQPGEFCVFHIGVFAARAATGNLAANHATPPDCWLVEISGILFGLESDMRHHGGNRWRGMTIGMTQRLGGSGNPWPQWRFWDEFGRHGTAMCGSWDLGSPVKTDYGNAVATLVWKRGKALIAVASWEGVKTAGPLAVEWSALDLNPTNTTFLASAGDGYQATATFAPDAAIPVEPGLGWLLVAEDEANRPVADTDCPSVERVRFPQCLRILLPA